MESEVHSWKETFFFFYWDISHYRPADMVRVNQLILEFLDDAWPSPSVNDDLKPWDVLLCLLMRSLRHHLAGNISPNNTNNYSWLIDNREHQWRPKKPYVDWVQFQPLITSPSGADQQDEAVRAILSHLGNVYRLRETQETWQHQRSYDYPGSGSYSDLDRGGPPRFMREIANPIIQDFWAFHSLPTWGVLIPVPIDVRELTQQLSTGKPFRKANAESMEGCCVHLYSSRVRLGLAFVPAKGRQTTRVILTFPEPQIRVVGHTTPRVVDHTTLQFAKCFYTGMLYWAGSIYKTGEVTPLKDFLDIQYVKWHDRDAHYAADIDKELWTAMRTIDIEKHK